MRSKLRIQRSLPRLWLCLLCIASSCAYGSSVRCKPPHEPQGKVHQIYEDDLYRFACVNFGATGEDTPGLHVYSRKREKWLRIVEISTINAKLGRNPNAAELKAIGDSIGPSVGWNFEGQYRKSRYVPMPLHTSGSIVFPERIQFDLARGVYTCWSGESWRTEAAVTKLEIRAEDLQSAFQDIYGKPPPPRTTNNVPQGL
jgi:hypothetical protein